MGGDEEVRRCLLSTSRAMLQNLIRNGGLA
jgi:hypothetical protein